MRFEQEIPLEILQSINFFNTINGGASPIDTKLRKTKDNYEITIKVPGVDLDTLHVEVKNNFVNVFQYFEFGEEFDIPRTISSFQIPVDADFKSISALDQGGVLKILIPFNEAESGYSKDIEIFKS